MDQARSAIDQGADIDAQDEDGFTALHHASIAGDTDMVEFLIKNCATIDLKDENGCTPLLVVAQEEREAAVATLIEHGADVNASVNSWTALHYAALLNNPHIVDMLVNNSAKVNLKNPDGWTPLHLTMQECHGDESSILTIVDLLISKGADVNTKSINFDTPLHYAVNSSYKFAVNTLLEHNASVDEINKDGNTPLHLAAQNDYTEIINLLLKHGASVYAENADYKTPLLVAAANGNVGATNILLQASEMSAEFKINNAPKKQIIEETIKKAQKQIKQEKEFNRILDQNNNSIEEIIEKINQIKQDTDINTINEILRHC